MAPLHILAWLATTLATGFCSEAQQLLAEQQIIGGVTVKIQTYNYQVQILYSGEMICGGSILSKTWILTAAHCYIEHTDINQYAVRAGSSYQGNSGVVIRVRKFIRHEKYNQPRFNNDIGLIELVSPLTYGTEINFIPLATTMPEDHEIMVVTGWGKTRFNGATSYQLQALNVPKVSQDICIRNYKNQSIAITNEMFCAGFLYENGKDTCNGDSGGPLAYHGNQVGIVSFGIGCDNRNYPTVFTNVVTLRNWITSHVRLGS